MSNCIFCKIIQGEIPSTKVYEDDKILAFKDINPMAPVHIVIVPKEHLTSLEEVEEQHQELMGYIMLKTKNIAKLSGINESGYRLICNCGKDGGQEVPHIHFHLVGGRELIWPAG